MDMLIDADFFGMAKQQGARLWRGRLRTGGVGPHVGFCIFIGKEIFKYTTYRVFQMPFHEPLVDI